MSDLESLLDTADRIVVTDLYSARCRTVIADLAATLRETSALLKESREYGSALVEELAARAAKTDRFVAMADSMDTDLQTRNTVLKKLVHDLGDLIANSEGVAGLHLNGEVAPWESLTAEGDFGAWLGSYDEAVAALQAAASEAVRDE